MTLEFAVRISGMQAENFGKMHRQTSITLNGLIRCTGSELSGVLQDVVDKGYEVDEVTKWDSKIHGWGHSSEV